MYEQFAWMISGQWGVAPASRISGGLAEAAIALALAIVAARLALLGIRTALGKFTIAEAAGDGMELAIKAALVGALISFWPTILVDLALTGIRLGRAMANDEMPVVALERMLGLVDHYANHLTHGLEVHLRHMGLTGTATEGTLAPLISDSPYLQALAKLVPGLDGFLSLIALLTQLTTRPELVLAGIAGTLGIIGTLVMCAVAIAGIAAPTVILFVVLALAPLVMAAYLADTRFSEELVSGWLDLLLTCIVAVPVIVALIAIMYPMLNIDPFSSTKTYDTMQFVQNIGNDFLVLTFFATFLAMPMSIASGMLNGRTPGANPLGLLFSVVTAVLGRVVKGARLLLGGKAGRK